MDISVTGLSAETTAREAQRHVIAGVPGAPGMAAPVCMVFVGERPSPLAARRGWRWEDGRVCAGTLRRALCAAGVDPAHCQFINLWTIPGLGPTQEAAHLEPVIQAQRQGHVIIALGRLVERALRSAQIPSHYMVHPAARGRIRDRAAYRAHVRTVVESITGPGAPQQQARHRRPT